MKYLYYCNSLYQLMTLLKLHFQRKENDFENLTNYSADLIILYAFDGARDVVSILKNEHIFDNVWIVEKRNSGHLKTISNLLSPKTTISDYEIMINKVNNTYHVICVPKYNKLIASIWQTNKKAQLELFDEGLASYDFTVDLESHSKIYKKWYKSFNANKDFYDYQRLYLNRIELCILQDNRVVGIPQSKEINNRIANLFTCISNKSNKQLLWFDQYYNQANKAKAIEQTLDSLEKYKDKVLFCPHPRKPRKSSIFENQVDKSLWEINAVNNKNINKLCLITYNSTACLSPKLIFDFEPYIIMTYSLSNESNKNIDDYVNKAKKIYRNPEKIMVPKTIDELNKYLALVVSGQ